MSLHVSSGKYKGRIVHAPAGIEPTRPTPGVVRAALFSILGPEVTLGPFCDLYAGTGSVAIEALSRGAPHATAVETHAKALACMRRTSDELGLDGQLEIIRTDVTRFRRAASFHVVFSDPPFASITEDMLDRCLALCRPGGHAILQWPSDRPREWPEHIEVRRYGSSQLVMARRP
ncbi:MAG: RsmD family RNA methyltransferase [Fibrobacterota bacterium]|nr:RsmD family RNA methyltransferase [Fibrobacterota bacterium]QQS04399.1 MAG: RsmD family RNA methyltransferase [Fibrobacterota bacterium]